MEDATLPAESLTIEQLAQQSGIAFTTIRLYQHRGLLPPPERRGRIGYYDDTHLARLRLIGELSGRGFSLAAIKQLVDDWQNGRSLSEVLGLESMAAASLTQPAQLRLRPEELASHFDGTDLTIGAMQRAFGLGLVAIEGDMMVVDPVFLDVGSTLVQMGFPVDTVLDEFERLRAVTAELAGRFTALFDRHLWQPFADAGMPEDQIGKVTDALAQLTPLAETIVTTSLRKALSDEAARFLAEQAVPKTKRPRRSNLE